LAVRHQADTAGLVLLSGYYFGTLRPDVLLITAGAIPVVGDVLRHTVSPWLGRLLMPLQKRAMFSPAAVTKRFRRDYSDAMALRPFQIRASSVDGTLMIPCALGLRRHYADLRLPVLMLAGDGDKVAWKRNAERLHAAVPGSTLRIVEGAGHMVHHSEPGQVVEAIQWIAETAAKLPVAALYQAVASLRAVSAASARAA
jgi:pimeloyl-ACP methyl ester carboxylesterase